MSGYLGGRHDNDLRGWDGTYGWTEIQGPAPRPDGWIDIPKPEEIADALVVTSWTCPFCKAENDVWGEGAVFSWMECPDCGKDSYLMM